MRFRSATARRFGHDRHMTLRSVLPLVGVLAALAIPTLLFARAIASPADPPTPAKLLKSKDVMVRLGAVQTLTDDGGEDAEKLLIGALKDKDWEVVERAADGLAEQGGDVVAGV